MSIQPRQCFFRGPVACFLLGIFSILCSCSRNYAERPLGYSRVASTVTQNDERNSLQVALQALQKDPTSINTLRVSSNGKEVSLLTAAVMFGEDTTIIKSLLDQGANIKAADREEDGVLHAIVDNPRWNDQQKAELIQYFYRKVGSVDDIDANHSRPLRKYGRPTNLPSTPWGSAFKSGYPETAYTILNAMSLEQVDRDGLFFALYGKADEADENVIRILLDKPSTSERNHLLVEQTLNDRINEEGVIRLIRDYCTTKSFRTRYSMHPWQHAWTCNYDPQTAICIITKYIPHEQPRMSNEAMATNANRVLADLRALSPDQDSLGDIRSEWIQIKEAFISIGVPANLLND